MLRLQFIKGGTLTELALTEHPLTIGRSPDADIVIDDDKASRLHCGIRLQDGKFLLKDLKSKNGTFLNDQRVEESELQAGDRIRVGKLEVLVVSDDLPGANTAVLQVQDEMALGKGYGTILREIVGSVEPEDKSAPRRRKSPPEKSA
jgi:pSer/pThr/pTyr-binding forkhead associated (FHA) protein